MTTTSNEKGNEKLEKLEGTIGSYNPLKTCGVLFTRHPVTLAVEKYFFHVSKLIISEVEIKDIQVGMFVRFLVSEVPPKSGTGNFPHATHVELYIQNPATVAGLEALSGSTSPEVSQ